MKWQSEDNIPHGQPPVQDYRLAHRLITFLLVREGAVLDSLNEGLHAIGHTFVHICETAQELWLEALRHTQGVCIDKDLPVGIRAGSNANRYSMNTLSNLLCKLCRYLLQRNAEASSLIQGNSVREQLVGLGLVLGAKTLATELMYALRGEPEMSLNRYSGCDDCLYGI